MQDTGDRNEERIPVNELLGKIDDVKLLGTDSVLQGEILVHLTKGRSTTHDLATSIFCNLEDDPPSRPQYMRVVRALGTLQRRGYVARALFGKEKPYKLTSYGREAVLAMATRGHPRKLVPFRDVAVYVIAASLMTASYALTSLRLNPTILISSWFITGIAAGLGLTRFMKTLRRIS